MAAIDNLGAYGEITKAAKEAGGVDRLISILESEAVMHAAPRLRIQGGLAAVGLMAIMGGVCWLYSRLHLAPSENLEAARNELREKIEGSLPQDESTEDGNQNSTTSPVEG